MDNQGIIKKLKFENHKVGGGNIFFIGLNEHLREADFKNMILEKVFFQNCNLENCYFLNSKIDKTEFRNCYFPQNTNRVLNNHIRGRYESIISLMLFPLLNIVMIWLSYIFPNSSYLNVFIIVILVCSFIPLLSSINLLVEFFSFLFYKFNVFLENVINSIVTLDKSLKILNVHYCIADEKLIYDELDNFLKLKDKKEIRRQKEKLQISLDSLSSSYSQLKDNFKDKDFQISGDFFYSQRYTELLSQHKKSFGDILIFNIHHFTNSFGESYIKPLIWFVLTILLFSFFLTPNKDFISTSSTPLFLIKSPENDVSDIIKYKLDIDNDFTKVLIVNGYKDLCSESKVLNLYGYDNRFNYHIKEQYILSFNNKENSFFKIKLIHSFSNMIYPFTPEQKRWFQNVSPRAVFLSLLESILLWYFAIAFILALWHRIKR